MQSGNFRSSCGVCRMNRRGFLAAGCAACAGAAEMLMNPVRAYGQERADKVRVRVIFALHAPVQPGPDWPNKGFDFQPAMEKVKQTLAAGCPNFEFRYALATGAEQAEKIVAEDKDLAIDGYLVYQMNCWNRVVQTVAATNKPVLYADFQFGGSGGFLVYNAGFLRQRAGHVGFVASSNPNDLVAAVRCFKMVKGGSANDFAGAVAKVRMAGMPKTGGLNCLPDPLKPVSTADCLRLLQESKILAVRDQNSGAAQPVLTIPLEYISFAEVNEAWKNADKGQARAVADRWQKDASAVVEVTRETLENSAAMYLGMKAVLQKHNANAITVNCLGGFYGGHIHAYPCLGFHELGNEGLIGACECDIRSTATMLMVNQLTQGRPGYISDPVIDTSKRQIIYAHCVASNRVFGPKGQSNPFSIMTHSEDRQGASVRSILPTGYLTTTLEVLQERKEILFHQARAVDNDPDDRACRTKLCAEPKGDIEKLFSMWDQWGWHRVTAYGDLKEPVYGLAEALGWKVVEEA